MPTARGIVVAVIAAGLALAARVWGVEEFALVALAVVAVVVCGLVVVLVDSRRLRRRLLLLTGPSREVTVGAAAAATVQVVWRGQAGVRSALSLQAGARWTVSYPGLGGPRADGDDAPGHIARARRGRPVLGAGGSTAVPALEPGVAWSTSVPVPTDRRGLWTMAPPRLWVLDPFGLVAWPVADGPSLHVVVCPDPGLAPPATLPSLPRAGVAAGGIGERRLRAAGGDEFAGLRAYVPGDRLHRLHWPALARRGELVMRDFVELQDDRVLLYVDVHRRDERLLEHAVAAAASSGVSALEHDLVVELRTSAGDVLTVVPGSRARGQLLRALAVIGPRER